MMLFKILHIGGVVVLIASACAVVWNRRVVVHERPALWRRLWGVRWRLGILLGLLSLVSGYLRYPEGREGFVRGLPFAVGGGTYGRPEDLPPPIVVITMQLNFLFWLLLPQLVLWATSGQPAKGAPPAAPEGGPSSP
jgi:hypothetical protein